MRELEKFKIDIYKLSNGEHNYELEISKAFFQESPEGEVEEGKGSVKVSLEKNETFIDAYFTVEVKVKLECDRSLEPFLFDINRQEHLIFKYGEEDAELDDDIVMIHRDTQRLDLAHYIYEFIQVAIPMKKLHPRYGEDSGEDELIYTSVEAQTPSQSDPRWEQLKKLKK